MSLTFCMLMLRKNRGGRFVLWSRIDQKSCIKSVLAAGIYFSLHLLIALIIIIIIIIDASHKHI